MAKTPAAQNSSHQRADLVRIAVKAMLDRGLEPEFSAEALLQLASIKGPGSAADGTVRDLTALPWCSIDNDDSRDLDQVTACEPLGAGKVRIRVAIADVDALVAKGSPLDAHAAANTTSVYTSARVFPMLPERLSTDLTSLNADADRLALVSEFTVAADASVSDASVYRARVRNRAKLAYDAVSAWLDGKGPMPEPVRLAPGMEEQLRVQDEVAQRLRERRRAAGSLEFETLQPHAVFDGDRVVDIREQPQNRGRQLIEELMIAANQCAAGYLKAAGVASLRRIVRSPERWARIVEVAARLGERLPAQPDSKALEGFLARRRKADPLRFPDLSLVIVKLMGSGEYVVERPGEEPVGHFGLAVREYMHSTAPNRRFPDLITVRMVKAHLAGAATAYTPAELDELASHCTQQEDAARKVERRVRKSEAALLLEQRIGQLFDAVVTGRSPSDTWVRVFSPPVEGKLVGKAPDLEVGRKLRVKLVLADVERGFIDFVLADRGD